MASAAGLATDAENKAATGEMIGGILKGVAAVASIAIPGLPGGSLGSGGMSLPEGAATGGLY
jgi:hypothetical protein